MLDYLVKSAKCVQDIYVRSKTNPRITVLTVGTLFQPDFEDYIIVSYKCIIPIREYKVLMLDGIYMKNYMNWVYGLCKTPLLSTVHPMTVKAWYMNDKEYPVPDYRIYAEPQPATPEVIAMRLIYGLDYTLFNEVDSMQEALHNILKTKCLDVKLDVPDAPTFARLLQTLCSTKTSLYNSYVCFIYHTLTVGYNDTESYLNILAYMKYFKDTIEKCGRSFRYNIIFNSALVMASVTKDLEVFEYANNYALGKTV